MSATIAAKTAAPAFVDRARGRQPSRIRSLFAATVVGFTAAALTYRMLRSTSRRDDNDDGADEDSAE